jgi:hypothetical protein
MERAYRGLREGDLYPLRRYAWYALRIRHQGRKGKTLEEFGQLQGLLDGTRNLGEVIAQGVPEALVRRYLVQALASGELAPPGRGGSSGTSPGKWKRKGPKGQAPKGNGPSFLLTGPVLAVTAAPDLAPAGATIALAHRPSLRRSRRKGASAPCASAGTSCGRRRACAG